MMRLIVANLKMQTGSIKMDIDITELTAYEIQRILSNYPRGRLAIKHDRIFWDSGDVEPVPRPNEAAPQYPPQQPPRQPSGQPPRQQPKGNDIGQRFARMADTLGSMMG